MNLHSENLLSRQNADGGWSYHKGSSWVEPTCYALLALVANGAVEIARLRRGGEWLARCQRPDGGLAPRNDVQESTWLTALTLLLPVDLIPQVDRPRAIAWVRRQTGQESGWMNQLRVWMQGGQAQDSTTFDGWPWYPGTAAWMAPTALSLLALKKLRRSSADQTLNTDLDARIAQGRDFLLARRCRDSGWNHGSTRALGYDSDSYPETTGLGLLALHGTAPGEIVASVARGEQHLAVCRSSEAASWLRLGLLAQGHKPMAPDLPTHQTTLAVALAGLADAAQAGRNVFLEL
jgi:prenyltransferase/squalene oxidase-like repeat protein